MRSKALMGRFDARRIQLLLALVFVGLAVPTVVLIRHAYGQLKWEAFHQHRILAEELINRIDTRLIERVRAAEARSFSDYAFQVVTGDAASNFLQRSPLSAFPVVEDVPGALGYFQVDARGNFSTPLLPSQGAGSGSAGINPDEYARRVALAREILGILTDNRLVGVRAAGEGQRVGGARVDVASMDPALSPGLEERAEADGGTRPSTLEGSGEPAGDPAPASESFSQRAFDELSNAPVAAGIAGTDDNDATATRQRSNRYGKVADLKLDASLEKKSEMAERRTVAEAEPRPEEPGRIRRPDRARRVEQATALPDQVPPTTLEQARDTAASVTTFESEIDPYEFSLLDSGHFVLFRKVWREGERYIQGLVIDQGTFLSDIVEQTFRASSLAAMSNLIVGYQGDVIQMFSAVSDTRYPISAGEMEGDLLYRSRLSAPMNGLELIFSITRLPAGPGATVLAWTTFVITAVFLVGFYALYRLALSQLELARQQQDFVSAVSHELKTPLTSIRMYGEMLKEGWVDDAKRRRYYEYIHEESERLSRLIANVLRLASITRNEPQLQQRPITVGELLAQTESKIATHVERAGFTLSVHRDEGVDAGVVNMDEDCFAQIMINLADNAIKFSRNAAQKRIDIGAQVTGKDQVIFAVRDYGPGVPKDQLKKIFRLFYRSESELTRETVGTGIGLAIVHQLTQALGGRVDVLNREPGAEFRLCFPLAG